MPDAVMDAMTAVGGLCRIAAPGIRSLREGAILHRTMGTAIRVAVLSRERESD